MLASCGPNREEIKEERPNREEIKEELEEEQRINRYISSTIKIGNLEVMTEDLEEINWYDAMKACADFGDGWRLPTKDELNILYQNQDKIGGFASHFAGYYWSSTEGVRGDIITSKLSIEPGSNAWRQYFRNGSQTLNYKTNTLYVRAVRSIE